MNLDLIKYRQMIAKKLRDQTDKNVQVDQKIAKGSNMNNIRNNVRYLTPNMPTKHVQNENNAVQDSDSDSDSELDWDAIKGGKFNFVKSIKKAGKSFGNDLGKGAKIVKDTAIKTGATMAGKDAGQYLYNGLNEAGKDVMNYAPEIAEDAGMTVAENPELLLMAAGMEKVKKEKRPCKISDKEKKRHALVKQLMSKHNISLPEASKLIKSKNIQY
jgi:hypothetical protein